MNATRTDRNILAAFHSSVFVIGFPGNCLVLMAYSFSKEFRSRPSNSCLLLLTIGDLLTSIFAPPYYATGLIVDHFDKSNPELYLRICKVAIFGLTTTGIVRIFAFTSMSIERFVAIVHPYYYARHCTRRKVFISAGFIWIHAMLSTLPAVLVDGWLEYNASNESICKFTSRSESIVYTAPMVLFNFTIPTVTVILMNVRVFWIARGKLRKILDEKQQFCKQCGEPNLESEISNEIQRRPSTSIFKMFGRRESKRASMPTIPNVMVEQYEDKCDNKGVDPSSYELQSARRTSYDSWKTEMRTISNDDKRYLQKAQTVDHKSDSNRERVTSFTESVKSHITLENIDENGEEDIAAKNKGNKIARRGTLSLRGSGYQIEKENSSVSRDSEVGGEKGANGDEQGITNLTKARSKTTPVSWLRRKSSFLTKGLSQGRCKHANSNRNASEMKILLSTLVLAFAFTLTWAPYVMTRLIITVWKETDSLRLQMFASASTVINCALNPIIILLTRKEVRNILKGKFFKKS